MDKQHHLVRRERTRTRVKELPSASQTTVSPRPVTGAVLSSNIHTADTIQWEGSKLRMLKGFSKEVDRSCKYDAAPVVSAPPPHAAPPPA